MTEPVSMSLVNVRGGSMARAMRPCSGRWRCRRSVVRLLLPTLVWILGAIPAHADPIQVRVEAWFQGIVSDTGMDVLDFFGGPVNWPPDAWATTALKSGPVLSVTFGELHTTYRLGPGELAVDASWAGAGGILEHGTFSASVSGFDFEVSENGRFSTGHATGTLGPGLFDVRLAKRLGVELRTEGGLWEMEVDVTNALEPGPVYREIGTNQTMFKIEAETCSPFPGRGATGGCFPGSGEFPVEVPEPSVLFLGAISAAGIALRRRR
jgi:hypothetical protein